MSDKPKLIDENGIRADGRKLDEMRDVKIVSRVLNNANGSCLVVWGKNKILAGVYGPRECIPRHDSSPYKAKVRCRYNMAPFCSLEEHGRSGPSRRSQELSKVISDAFENVVISESFPRTAIDVYIDVLQSDGGTRCAALTAAAVAIADAGIPCKDLISAVAVGKVGDKIALDLSKDEDNYGQSDNPMAFSARNSEILLYQMDGLLTKDEVEVGLKMAADASKKIHKLQVDALKEGFEKTDDKKLPLSIQPQKVQ